MQYINLGRNIITKQDRSVANVPKATSTRPKSEGKLAIAHPIVSPIAKSFLKKQEIIKFQLF